MWQLLVHAYPKMYPFTYVLGSTDKRMNSYKTMCIAFLNTTFTDSLKCYNLDFISFAWPSYTGEASFLYCRLWLVLKFRDQDCYVIGHFQFKEENVMLKNHFSYL